MIRPRTSSVSVTPELIAAILLLDGYGVLQVEIARRLGCSQSTVSRVRAKARCNQAEAV